ncbi:IclR family transcriptional regulator [Fusibacter bizertensis]|jgi:Transcriptional regulator|uniref:IclR family transcriptional regulator n=1 Tax=Fusibacter bizertensis TaxID=1488331 RepID=A0ABT6NA96_9FIRM|nr:IclR family transcriptional regulator [Fusibacter bizertensis]MDH8677347.1 IclR family transcriptional regulator [Fusibacter bizertensis]
MNQDDIKVKSLYKTLKVLECFTSKTPELGITEIGNALGLYKSNVHNLISTLEFAGYVEKNPLNSKYHLTNKMLEFSYVVTSQLNYQDVVYQVLKRLTDELGEMMYFGVPHGTHVLYMFNAYPQTYDHNYPIRSIMGEKAPMYCTSLGKAMMSTMSEVEIRACLDIEKEKFTPFTLIDDDEIMKEIMISKERGYALDNVEHEPDVRCVGVPIFGRSQNLIGALSISGASHNFDDEKVHRYASILIDAAYEIKRRL